MKENEKPKIEFNARYTADGKKIKIIEKIGEEGYQTLVKEIFVDKDENEYPAGETFLINSKELFHVPPQTWEDRNNEKIIKKELEIKEQCEIRKANLINLRKDLDSQINKTKKIIKISKEIEKHFSEKDLDQLKSFLSGDIKYYAILNKHESPEIIKFEDSDSSYYTDINGIRLLTLFGNSKGDLKWRINEYRDSSGNFTTVIPCNSYKEACEKITEFINNENHDLCNNDLKAIKKYNLKINKEKINTFFKEKLSREYEYLARIKAEYVKNFKKTKREITEITLNFTSAIIKEKK